jgi:hypothetical protein
MFLGLGVLDLLRIALVPAAILAFGAVLSNTARRFGYASMSSYLHAVPVSDMERGDAVDLLLKGAACCSLGILYRPFFLVGLLPLFFGTRKLLLALMGIDLTDEPDSAR